MLKRLFANKDEKERQKEHERLTAEREQAAARLAELEAEAQRLDVELGRAVIEGRSTAELRQRLRENADARDDVQRLLNAIDEALEATKDVGLRARAERLQAELERMDKEFEPVRKCYEQAEKRFERQKAAFEQAQREYWRERDRHVDAYNRTWRELEAVRRELEALKETTGGDPGDAA